MSAVRAAAFADVLALMGVHATPQELADYCVAEHDAAVAADADVLLARPVLEATAKAVADSATVWAGFAMQDAKTCVNAAIAAATAARRDAAAAPGALSAPQVSEVLPCPFCGSAAHVSYDPVGWAANAHVHCVGIDCRADVWSMHGKDAAIALWNKRAAPSVAVAQDAQTVRDAALEDAALLAIQWGNARVDDGGGHALRNYAEDVRSLKSSGDAWEAAAAPDGAPKSPATVSVGAAMSGHPGVEA